MWIRETIVSNSGAALEAEIERKAHSDMFHFLRNTESALQSLQNSREWLVQKHGEIESAQALPESLRTVSLEQAIAVATEALNHQSDYLDKREIAYREVCRAGEESLQYWVALARHDLELSASTAIAKAEIEKSELLSTR